MNNWSLNKWFHLNDVVALPHGIPMPISLAKISAKMIETFMSKPLITVDQLNLLKYDNTPTGDFKTNFDFNINAEKKFEQEIEKYSSQLGAIPISDRKPIVNPRKFFHD